MKTILASVAFLAFAAAPALAGGMGGCASMTTAMSKKPVAVEQLASAEMLKLVDGKRLALV
ncbi:MAG: hypothetical protein ACRCT6_11270 [Notoacmeibacter sp.]